MQFVVSETSEYDSSQSLVKVQNMRLITALILAGILGTYALYEMIFLFFDLSMIKLFESQMSFRIIMQKG